MQLDTSCQQFATDPKTGQQLKGVDGKPVRVALDIISGKLYAKVADVIPSDPDPASQQRKADILKLQPEHVPGAGGYWVPVEKLFPEVAVAQPVPAA